MKFVKESIEFYLAQCQLIGGKKFKDDRLKEVKNLFLLLKLNDHKNLFICGDFNENLEKGSNIINILQTDMNFLIGDEE